ATSAGVSCASVDAASVRPSRRARQSIVPTVKVSCKFQITLPARIRKQLEIRPGDRLLVDVCGDHIMLMCEPEDYAAALKGLHAAGWVGVDPREYVQRERDAWRD